MRRLALAAFAAVTFAATPALAADFTLSVSETGTRDYYCTTTVTVDNGSDVLLNEINGSLVLLDGEESVGNSKGGSLLAADAGASTSHTFDAPNAPCADVTAYRFMVSICRIDGSFVQAADCMARIAVTDPIMAVEAK